MPDRSLRPHPLPSGPFASGPRAGRHAAPPPQRGPALPQARPHEPGGTPSSRWDAAVARRVHGSGGSQGPGGVHGAAGVDQAHGSDRSDDAAGADDARDEREPQGPGERGDNPFAPPPEGTPDRPWRPRHRPGGPDSGSDSGSGDQGGRPSPWDQWSDRQPGRAQGGRFGDRPRNQNGPEGPGGPGDGGTRWDPTDPAQRRARYALLSGMWAFFFSLFGWRDVALLLGALGLYWGISSLRAKSRRPDPAAPRPAAGAAGPASASDSTGARPQTTAAISGLVTASLALAMVATTLVAQLVYRDYYTCANDALTTSAEHSCQHLLPEKLRTVLSTEP